MRYVPVVRRLRRTQALGRVRILEIGANENGFARFAKTRVIAANASLSELLAARSAQDILPVVADARALPFPDHCADVCLCLDTLEHIPESSREAVLDSIARVVQGNGVAVVAFPAGDAAARAEARIRTAYMRATGRALTWFEEHERFGLPDVESVRETLASLAHDSHSVHLEKNAPVWIWDLVWRILMCGWPGRGNAAFQALLRLVTPVLCRVRLGSCYRVFVWLYPKASNHAGTAMTCCMK